MVDDERHDGEKEKENPQKQKSRQTTYDGLLHRKQNKTCSFFKTYLEPADVKSPHTSVAGWAAERGDPKSTRGAEIQGSCDNN